WQVGAGLRAGPGAAAVYTATRPSSIGTLTFQGDTLALVFAAGPWPAPAQVQLDGAAPPGLPAAGGSAAGTPDSGPDVLTVPAVVSSEAGFQAVPAWPAPPGRYALQVEVAAGLAAGRHTLTI